MSTLHLVDPELVPTIAAFPKPELSRELLPFIRARHREMLKLMPPPPETPGLEVRDATAKGRNGHEVGVVIYAATAAKTPMPAILHIHGGGYVVGTPLLNDAANRALAPELGCVIVSVDYRLAPETPYPGPLDDCYAALEWLHDNADALGVDRARIAVSGESAGGGLTAGLALLARDRGEIPIAFQHLVAPMLDDRTCLGHDPNPSTGEFMWTPEGNHFGWAAYLGRAPGGADIPYHAAAARAETLEGLPATYISTGSLDLFLDENLAYARRLSRAGVPIELHVYPGAFHGFQLAAGAALTRNSNRDSAAAFARALRG